MIQFLLIFTFLFLTLLNSAKLMAGPESTATLPNKIRSPEFIYNIIDGLGDKYDSKGNLIKVTDSFNLDLSGLGIAKFSAEGARLVNVLNGASSTERLGDSLSLGQIHIDSQPSLNYWVINPAYGVRKDVSIGLAIPIVHYKNKLQVSASGVNNVEAIKNYLDPSKISDEMAEGFNRLSAMSSNLPETLQSELKKAGYKSVSDVDFETVGDILIYTRYRYYDDDTFHLALRPYILLPTGRPDDPDDLADVAIGGYSGFGLFSTNEVTIIPKWVVSFIFQYQTHVPDRAIKRVPLSVNDILPKIKENLARQVGNIYDITWSNRYYISRSLSAGAFYEMYFKDPDWYSGSQGYNYGLLANDSGSQAQRLGWFVDYSTTDLYFANEAPLPFILGYIFSTTLNGVNTPNQTAHIFSMRLFF